MKCKFCDTEMFTQRQEEVLIHKCPNPQCQNFGYQQEKKEEAKDNE